MNPHLDSASRWPCDYFVTTNKVGNVELTRREAP
jgi:hypothetical protein